VVQSLYKDAIVHSDVTNIKFTVFGKKMAKCKKKNEMCTNNLMNCIALVRTSLYFQKKKVRLIKISQANSRF